MNKLGVEKEIQPKSTFPVLIKLFPFVVYFQTLILERLSSGFFFSRIRQQDKIKVSWSHLSLLNDSSLCCIWRSGLSWIFCLKFCHIYISLSLSQWDTHFWVCLTCVSLWTWRDRLHSKGWVCRSWSKAAFWWGEDGAVPLLILGGTLLSEKVREVWGPRLAAHDGENTTLEQPWRQGRGKRSWVWDGNREKPTQVKFPLFFLRMWSLGGNPTSRDRAIPINPVLSPPLWRCEHLFPDVFALFSEQMLCAGCSLLFLAGGNSNKILNSTFRWRRAWVEFF